MTEIDNIISLLTRTFEKDAWHGPSVREVLTGITTETCFQRLPDTHSIIELVAHMTSWRNYVSERLNGNDLYKVTDELNFPVITDWLKAVQLLEESQQRLLHTLRRFNEKKLYDIVPNNENRYSYYVLLHGIIHHDLYHVGQIALIRKAHVHQTV